MINKSKFLLFIFISFCHLGKTQEAVNYGSIPTFSDNNFIQAVIEIPAGTNHKIEYDYATNSFPCDQKNGKDRIINFLPYPGNYGFIPSTFMDPNKGGDGDALDVLVISESQKTTSVLEVIPIAILQLKDGGKIDDKIIAFPVNEDMRVVSQLSDDMKLTLVNWFASYKGKGIMEFVGWKDASQAENEINKWLK